MPLKKATYSRPGVRIYLFIGCVIVWAALELTIERSDDSLFIPQTSRDHVTDGTTFYSGFLVNTNGCRIPDLDPMDISVRKFVYDEPVLNCSAQYGPALVLSNLTAVYINTSALSYYNVTVGQISCCYRPFWREEVKFNPSGEYPSNVDSTVRFADNCVPFLRSATIHNKYVKVECSVGNDTVYKDYYAFFPKDLSSNTTQPQHSTNSEEAVSVLVFGVDAVSRLNLYRQMPKTLKFLKKTLNAVEMLGYNKVEDNTFPNLIPVLTGLTTEELKQKCWPKTHYVFDDCNFIWNNFSDLGFKTAFGEDASWMGIFNYVKRGFRKQPTDYYMRVLNKVAEDDIGFEKRLNANLCIGPRKSLETLIDYASKFSITMKDVLTFSFFWGTSLSHDYLNLPKYGDEDHKVFFESLYNHGIFNNTILVFLSDHGIRWGGIRGTYQGYLEERLPFLFIVYPDWFRSKYTTAVSNLKRNAKKLTTPFDLHELLKDLTNLKQLEKETLKKRSEALQNAQTLPRGISMFLPVPGDRTCPDAGIVDHWCTCHQSKDISTNNTLVRQASAYLVKHINYLLHDFTQCVELTLKKIMHAREEKSISHSSFETSDKGLTDLSITIQTTPGNGLFESTVRHDGNQNSFSVVGTISRINLYGDQSKCMPNYKLRLYCYCNHE
ncbi:uncharacterized protein LOC129001737 isoform X1 [Macrosteles quadrilineatus]|uniref:uncharacterized protein LOC129001737 isoform X1 n=1 Tax=Macrosteles quadrilineatus TaxID=74068 RepID=UPI0023E29828|nr:uncharacterized protein LOC129001737 isoform X1 [Macrosteles quadrilineatus]XP_054285124.1 uncharacterized protein LOC129001737 isoform X1 [Macrosteles quadrilineatus]